jgi:hypothetical protein
MKVHFADCHTPFRGAQCFLDAGVRYTLQTFYGIHKNKHRLAYGYDVLNKFQHIIIDSGLFSIMFGCEAGTTFGEKEARAWFEEYVGWINQSQFKNASYVECDVQKKLGVEAAWEYRKEMKARIAGKGTVINVYHLEDGNPDKLIDFADYIAVSIPELRFNVSDKERYQITRYITSKAHAKGKRIHLLGCTEKKMMREFSFCYSCDSTSWSSGFRYGHLKNETLDITKMSDIEKIAGEKYEKKRERETYMSAALLMMEYRKYAGDQT